MELSTQTVTAPGTTATQTVTAPGTTATQTVTAPGTTATQTATTTVTAPPPTLSYVPPLSPSVQTKVNSYIAAQVANHASDAVNYLCSVLFTGPLGEWCSHYYRNRGFSQSKRRKRGPVL